MGDLSVSDKGGIDAFSNMHGSLKSRKSGLTSWLKTSPFKRQGQYTLYTESKAKPRIQRASERVSANNARVEKAVRDFFKSRFGGRPFPGRTSSTDVVTLEKPSILKTKEKKDKIRREGTVIPRKRVKIVEENNEYFD